MFLLFTCRFTCIRWVWWNFPSWWFLFGHPKGVCVCRIRLGTWGLVVWDLALSSTRSETDMLPWMINWYRIKCMFSSRVGCKSLLHRQIVLPWMIEGKRFCWSVQTLSKLQSNYWPLQSFIPCQPMMCWWRWLLIFWIALSDKGFDVPM